MLLAALLAPALAAPCTGLDRTPVPEQVAQLPPRFELDPRLLAVLEAEGMDTIAKLRTTSDRRLAQRWQSLGHPPDDYTDASLQLRSLLADLGTSLGFEHPLTVTPSDLPAPQHELHPLALPSLQVQLGLPAGAEPPATSPGQASSIVSLPTGDRVTLTLRRGGPPTVDDVLLGTPPNEGGVQRCGDWGVLLEATRKARRFPTAARWDPAQDLTIIASFYEGTPSDELTTWLRDLVVAVRPLTAP